MSRIVVLITTDHEDHDEAIRSVSGAMKRVGYDFTDYEVGMTADRQSEVSRMFADGFVQVCEPEVNRAARQV